jgi:hypothetical protein
MMNQRIWTMVQETAAEQSRKLGIDPQVAAKGKVDFVRVETWAGDGTEAALENLPMKSFSPAFVADEDTAPFYEQLVRRLQLLDSKVNGILMCVIYICCFCCKHVRCWFRFTMELKLGSVFIGSGTASPDSAVLSLLDCCDC